MEEITTAFFDAPSWKTPTVSFATFRLLTSTTNVQSLEFLLQLKLGCPRIDLVTGLLSTQRNRRLT